MRIIIAMTGASGAIYGIRLVEELVRIVKDVEIHLIISDAAKKIINFETDYNIVDIEKMANKVSGVFKLANFTGAEAVPKLINPEVFKPIKAKKSPSPTEKLYFKD